MYTRISIFNLENTQTLLPGGGMVVEKIPFGVTVRRIMVRKKRRVDLVFFTSLVFSLANPASSLLMIQTYLVLVTLFTQYLSRVSWKVT